MPGCCTGGCASEQTGVDPKYRRILWIALVVNALMFAVELAGGWTSGSVSLLADAVDFLGDAANYLVAIVILAMSAATRARAALVKGVTMGGYGIFVLGMAGWHFATSTVPEASTMGAIGLLALAANGLVAALLFAYRNGDANMRSVWLCTRNDAIGNVAVMFAALGVFGTGTGWPDLVVASVMGILGLTSARMVIAHARQELKPSMRPATEALEPERP
ncbi:cation transporter [Massilia cavernae]|uniref:Cation transporter n=1 Tax=Massilia cavernae TaxID=2320864 RepID=A0A418XR59_9BURK|nr:cation transporter [Massilia cavernae]RJG14932.1 cation transporter [Massilia cavernae]